MAYSETPSTATMMRITSTGCTCLVLPTKNKLSVYEMRSEWLVTHSLYQRVLGFQRITDWVVTWSV